MSEAQGPGPTQSPELIRLGSRASRIAPGLEGGLARWPWWLIVTILLGLIILLQILTDGQNRSAFMAVTGFNEGFPEFLAQGIAITLRVTFFAYLLAVVIGLIVGLMRVSSNVILLNLASFYVEIVRGIPILVLLMYVAFVLVPFVADLVGIRTRDFPQELRVIFALAFAYGAFESEVFRAGIQSIEKGQMEAARALGMSYFQAMRHIIIPQAVRRILPALGNDFIAMLKDSSLVSALGVEDITQKAKLYAASTFLFFQTYTILAFIYLFMTILLSRGVRYLETRMSVYRR
jgi:His/Glu/Gln/Arg/opine family amino acid ABC transporter permease subunit